MFWGGRFKIFQSSQLDKSHPAAPFYHPFSWQFRWSKCWNGLCISSGFNLEGSNYGKYPKMTNDRYHHLVILLTYLPLHHNLILRIPEVLISIAPAPSRSHVFTVTNLPIHFCPQRRPSSERCPSWKVLPDDSNKKSTARALVWKLQRLLCHVVKMFENQMVRKWCVYPEWMCSHSK